MNLPVKVGDTITIKAADCYASYGDVTLRITGLPDERLPPGSDWIQVTGVEIDRSGQEIDERTALVRTAALRPLPAHASSVTAAGLSARHGLLPHQARELTRWPSPNDRDM